MNTEISGKVVLITGASGGIGSAIARQFAEEGAKLVLHYNSSGPRIRALAKGLPGTETLALRADLTKERDVRTMFAKALEHFGRIHTLVANAASWEIEDTPLHRMSLRHWQKTLNGVLTSAFLSMREFLKIVARQKHGNAVLIGSTAAVFGEAGHADYSSGKAALAYGLTRSLKNEITRIAPHTNSYCGGRVNCVCPGWTVVPRLEAKLGNHDMIRRVTATMPLPQLARPEDIANAVVFLSSDKLARHITGQILVLAGGMEGRQLWRPDEVDTSLV